ncbi:MAG: sodium:calcium antiporter [Thermoleophilia bacterium]|nr:sodium:calcium antiporter [Thermoleophilia bacterium]
MFGSLSLAPLILIFLAAGGLVWGAGAALSDNTDVLDQRLGFGDAVGGQVLLAFATNLPEIAIVTSSALAGAVGIATGNILGGIAIQTVVLALLDGFGLPFHGEPLTYRAASLDLVVEGLFVVAILGAVIAGTQMPHSAHWHGLEPVAIAIVLLWVASIAMVSHARTALPWHERGDAPGGQDEPRAHSKQKNIARKGLHDKSTGRATLLFAVAAAATLAGGVVLEESGREIANHIGMTGVVFGATFLAAATALPEVSTGLTAVRLGDYKLAVSDIFGGNAFLPVLFLPAGLLATSAVITNAATTDIFLTGLAIVLTVAYICGLLFRPRRQVLGLGIDSVVVVLLYAIGLAGLFVIA